ncbi:hypothetical protein CASFOL_023435 [Castilleja foliolosa]|uniref:SWIM-type domain-containing protein n=1 Tax=Castilleja foliolosa TaxID=1961234 RepID=A0ABD3CMB6_9LAMI
MVDNNWTVKLHHGGQFVDKPRKAYVKGKVAVFNGMEEDKMSLPEFWDMGKELNYPSPRSYNYYYKIPKLSMAKGLVLLETDMDVLKMLECHLDTYVINAYMVPPDVAAEVQEVHAKNAPVNEEAGDGQPDANDDGMSLGNDEQEDNIVPEELDNQEEAVFMEELDEAGTDEEKNSDNDVIDEGVNKITFGDEEEDHRLDSDIEDDVYRLVDDFVQRAEPDKDGRGSRHNEDDVPVAVSDDEENGSREYDSDELRSIDGSGEDQDISKYVLYREPTKPQEKPILKVGMKFVDARQFRKALRSHAVLSGYDIHFKKNEGGRVTCVCKESQESKKEGEIGCKWRIHASWNDEESAFIIKTYNPDHGCSRVFENTQATSAVLSNMYIENLRDDPDWKLSAMQKAVNRELGIDVSTSKIYNAKKKAKKAIEGDFIEQYSLLWDYCNILKIRNPGSYVKMKVERLSEDDKPTFQRLFISYGAWIEGFKSGCRKLIGLDGCFLKGSFGGQLLSAVGRDANNGMFPIAIAVVEAETTDSWTWFLNQLLDAIGSVEDNGWCFISDRQKGLEETFETVIPQAHHRFCLRHLYANFKTNGFKSLKLKEEMWLAAAAFNKEEFLVHMMNIKKEDLSAYEYLSKVEPSQWARSYFDPAVKCELLCNNLSESWNHFIIKAREKPILTMLEMIRRLVMRRIQVNSSKMAKYEGLICPKAQAKLDMCKENSRHCQTLYSGCRQFEVLCHSTFHAVDLDQKTCSCKRWDFTGIPCNHAVAAIWKMKLKPESFVDVYFQKQTYMKQYKPIMNPLIDKSLWPKTGHEPVLPPVLRSKPGRPKKKRRRATDEAKQPYKLKRLNTSLQCKTCHQYGHNSRTCKGAPVLTEGRHKTTRPLRAKGGRPSNDDNGGVGTVTDRGGGNVQMRGGRPVHRGGGSIVRRGGGVFKRGGGSTVRGRGGGLVKKGGDRPNRGVSGGVTEGFSGGANSGGGSGDVNVGFSVGTNTGGGSGGVNEGFSGGTNIGGGSGGVPDTTSGNGSAVRDFGGLNDSLTGGGSPLGSFGGGAIRREGGAINIPTRSLSVRGAVLWYESSKRTSFKFSQSAPPNSQD